MNIRVLVIVVFLIVVSGGLMVHFRQQSITEPSQPSVPSDIPVPPKAGPYGKFVVEGSPVHNFGIMEFGQKGSHQFKIRNDGPGPLRMVARKEDHTCQCTLGSLGTDGLKPGEETTVTLSWEIKNPSTHFEHSAKIRTDDPENPVTAFRVRGLVGKRLTVATGTDINLGTLSEKQPTERTFAIHSETVDSFEITKLEPSVPLMTATFRPLVGEELKHAAHDLVGDASARMLEATMKAEAAKVESAKVEADTKRHADDGHHAEEGDELAGKNPEAKCGYEVKVVFQPGFPIGRFRETLAVHTNLPETPPVVVVFEGNRAGPVQILGTPGISWSPELSLLHLGRFRADDGKKARLLVFVKKTEVPWEITSAKIEPPIVKYQLVKDENFKGMGRDRYDLVIEVPAGEAPLSLSGDSKGSLILNTNHPEANLIKIDLEFTSY